MRKKLQEARRQCGMKQQDVADCLEINVQSYQRIEYGTRIGTVETWDKLEDLFGVTQRVLRENTPKE